MSTPLIFFFFFILFSEAKYQRPISQGDKLVEYRLFQAQKRANSDFLSVPNMVTDFDSLAARIHESQSSVNNKEDHFLKDGLPGQPLSTLGLKQFAGNLDVDVKSGRSLFYYHVESQSDPAFKPLILWLNGGE